MRRIPLTHGKKALIDDADFALVTQSRWYAFYSKSGGWYAARGPQRNNGERFLHRVLMGVPRGVKIDHKDGDGLNCRRSNMRVATQSQNGFNRKLQRNNKSGFRGVYRARGKWRAQIKVNGKITALGYHETPEQAARAYDAKVLEVAGEFARLNFPRKSK